MALVCTTSLIVYSCLLLQSVWARVELEMPQHVEVYLGNTAIVPCYYTFKDLDHEPTHVVIEWFVKSKLTKHDNASSPELGPSSSWTRIFYGDKTSNHADRNVEYSGRINVLAEEHGSQLIIKDVRPSDDGMFFCKVNAMAAGNAEGSTHLRVFAPPGAPVIEGFPGNVSATSKEPSKVASCKVGNGFPEPNITWYRNSAPLMPKTGCPGVNFLTLVTRESGGLFSVHSTLEYKVTREDKDANFSCGVRFFAPGAIRTLKSGSVNITVHYPSTMVKLWKESPWGLVKEGDAVELRCHGDGNPPPTFSFTKEQEPNTRLLSGGGVLLLSPVSRRDSGIYQCRPLEEDSHEDVKAEIQLTVHYLDPAVVEPKDSEVELNGNVTATCNASSSLETSTVWYKDGQQVGKGNTLHLMKATENTTGEYVCKVVVPSLPVLHTNGTIHVVVQVLRVNMLDLLTFVMNTAIVMMRVCLLLMALALSKNEVASRKLEIDAPVVQLDAQDETNTSA